MLSDILKRDEIAEFFSRSAFSKAAGYHIQRRVKLLEVDEKARYIRSEVRGSLHVPYDVEISLTCNGGQLLDVIGDCSCPVGMNCKHVAATLLEIVSGGTPAPASRRDRVTISPSSPPVLPQDVASWLERIGYAQRGEEYPPEITQRLIYCLGPQQTGVQPPRLHVSLVAARILKDGKFADNFTQPNLSNVSLEQAPKYYRDSDIEIIGRLSRQSGYGFYGGVAITSAELLKTIVATGRARWLNHDGEPLRWGDQRSARIEWRQASKDGVVPQLVVQGGAGFVAAPPIYVDDRHCTVGALDVGVPAHLAFGLLSAPTIPTAQVAEVARRLARKLPSVPPTLLPAEPSSVITIKERPTPVLRLTLLRLPSYGYGMADEMPAARVLFRYGSIDVDPTEQRNVVEIFRDGQMYEIIRQRSHEREAIKHVRKFGALPIRSYRPYADRSLDGDLTFPGARQWLDFLGNGVNSLKEQGFEIRIDDDFPYGTVDTVDDVDAELQGSGIDWFELGVGVRVDGEQRDLTAALAAMIADPHFNPELFRKSAAAGDRFYVRLEDKRYVALAANRFLALVIALHDLHAQDVRPEASGRIRLTRADVVPLLESETAQFAFKGADSLRRLAGLLRTRDASDVRLPAGFKTQLRPYQTHGVVWLDLLREAGFGGILADDMGLGKTVQLLALVALVKARGDLTKPALVVAPTSLMTNWVDEAKKFVPDLRVLLLQGSDRKQQFARIPECELVLTTYPLIVRDRQVLLAQEWHLAVLDEAQTVKNPDATTTRILRDIRADHRFCLTGTPMENHLGELWSIMNFANPGYLGDKRSFVRTWRTPIEKGGDRERASLLARRIRPFLLRRTKSEVAIELPPKTEITERVTLEGAQRDLYDSIRLSMSAKVREALRTQGLAKSHIVILEALLRLRQACCHPALLKLDDGVVRPAAKLDRLMEMVEELLSEGRKIIIFSQFTSMIDLIRPLLEERGISYSLLTGSTTDRKGAIQAFQKGTCDLFLISLKAGGVGLNLTAADTVIVFDPWWNPAVEEQAIDRAHRIGQDKAVFVYRLVAAETVEEKMSELKARKRALADSVFDREGRVGPGLTEDDIRVLFEP